MKKLIILILLTPLSVLSMEKLTMDRCREMALENNKALKMAAIDRETAAMQTVSAHRNFLPEISSNAGFLRRNKKYQLFDEDKFLPVIPHQGINPETGSFDPSIFQDPDLAPQVIVINPQTGEPVIDPDGNPVFQNYAWLPMEEGKFGQKNNYQAGVSLTQPIYAGGRIRAGYRMSKAGENIALSKEHLSVSEVIARTDELFWKVITMEEKDKLADAYQEMLGKLVSDLEDLLNEGIITQNQLMEARVRLNEVRLQKKRAENGLKLSRMALAQIIGMPIHSHFELKADFEPNPKPADSENLTMQALSQRPEIKMLEETKGIYQEKIKMSRAEMLPVVGMSAGYTIMNPNPYGGFRDEFGGDWNIGISINIPIYHFGERRNRVSMAQKEASRQELRLEETREMVELEISQARFTFEEAQSEVSLTALSLEQAEENLRSAEDLFREGRATTRDVLEAQALWQQAHAANIRAKNQFRLAYTQLLKTSGELHQNFTK